MTLGYVGGVTDDEYAEGLSPHMPIDAGIVRAVRVLRDAGGTGRTLLGDCVRLAEPLTV